MDTTTTNDNSPYYRFLGYRTTQTDDGQLIIVTDDWDPDCPYAEEDGEPING